MTEQNKISSDVEATVGSEQVAMPSQGRRRFTKGALLATPAVMTLMSGRLASADSVGACTGKLPTPREGDNINWVDANGLPLIWGTDSNGNRVLGYNNSNGEFVPTTSTVNSNSCLASVV